VRRHATNVRIPDDLAERLEDEAKAAGQPVAWMLARILRERYTPPDPPSSAGPAISTR